MDIAYCNNNCSVGIAKRNEFLDSTDSVFDAAFDFNCFVENCFKSCPYKEANTKQKEIAE